MDKSNQKSKLLPILDIENFRTNNLEGLCILDHSIEGKSKIDPPHKHNFFLFFLIEKGSGYQKALSTMKKMNRFSLLLFCLFVFCHVSCQQDRDLLEIEDPIEQVSSQYGTPFQNVPETEDIIMYEVNPLVFSSQGNLNGVTERLDEIKALGVNVVWLMPIHPIGEERGIGSPYSIKDFYGINPAYGTLEDLRKLVQEAHSRDMAVIMDLVANHTSWDNPWITKNRSWYEQTEQGEIKFPQNWTDVAQLDYTNPSLREEMKKVMEYWVLEANIDGYRCDYADGVPVDFWTEAISSLRSIPDREIIMFAEGAEKSLFNADFDMIFGWNFYHRLKNVFTEERSANGIFQAHNEDYSNLREGAHFLRFTTNHDDNGWDATPLEIFGGSKGALTAYATTVFMGGIPMMYNGQEIDVPDQIPFFFPKTYTIDWSINPDVFEKYSEINRLRNQNPALRKGELKRLSESEDVISFTRTLGEDVFFLVFNLRDRNSNFLIPEEISQMDWTTIYGDDGSFGNEALELSGFEFKIFKSSLD
ncbi:1,4-alpha-glucan branching enzyme [Indibacter alkaliphilus LW1]|uniref:1,4-alpha-glucan branching enzyme n=2 Tax=Indibacter TaxID=647744 RepID=S2E058_INDAL|nr:1,4-alpha-glucan branching enzyme [Indibacter alkaliphilus LW1]